MHVQLRSGAETFKPTETIAPNIPGVVAAGTRVLVVAQGLRGTEGPIAAPDGALLLTEQQANVITKIDAKGTRSTFLENTNGFQGLTYDPKGRLIGVLPATKQIGVLMPARSVLASTFEGRPFLAPTISSPTRRAAWTHGPRRISARGAIPDRDTVGLLSSGPTAR